MVIKSFQTQMLCSISGIPIWRWKTRKRGTFSRFYLSPAFKGNIKMQPLTNDMRAGSGRVRAMNELIP